MMFSRALLRHHRHARRFFGSAAARDFAKAPPLVIRNGTVVNHDGQFKADVLTRNGVIEKVGNVGTPDFDHEEIDATGKYVIPGGIDTHTHMEMPFMGTTSIDDYHYGTQAAIFVFLYSFVVHVFCQKQNR